MTFNQLHHKFLQGMTWNGTFYVIYKVCATAFSFLLYYKLSTKNFSLWANINSLVFITLLWIDLGLRKSLPRYCPEFARHPNLHKRFILWIITVNIGILLAALPIFSIIQHKLYSTHSMVYVLSCCFLITEGIIALLRLLFYSHSWIKEFNSFNTIIVISEMFINYLLIVVVKEEVFIVVCMVNKIIMGCITIFGTGLRWQKLYKQGKFDRADSADNINRNYKSLRAEFCKHSIIMWFNTNIKSLTERNFMVPLLTYNLGPEQANIFKVANDGALLLYRSIIKTVGTTDTSLFTQVDQLPDAKKLLPIAFKKVMSSIAALCFPLLGIIGVLALINYHIFEDRFVFQLFIIITSAYLFESILSPYERILEVKKCYRSLFNAYIPYILMIITILIFKIIPLIGLGASIIAIHGVRLVSSLCMIPYAHKELSTKEIVSNIYTYHLLSWYRKSLYTPFMLFMIIGISWYLFSR